MFEPNHVIGRAGSARRRGRPGAAVTAAAFLLLVGAGVLASTSVPTEIQQPGTQPGEASAFQSPDNCDNCHGGYYYLGAPPPAGSQPEREPGFGWRGGMMANASRDPLFWATMAIAEQDFLPGIDPVQRGGVGDLCLRCHTVNAWISGRSTPTNGAALSPTGDADGVECEFCHLLVDPDQSVNVAGTTEAYTSPFEAFDPATGEGHRGSGQYVLNGAGQRLGPYADANAKHQVLASPFHRQGEMCGTCHDVSNPAVGDLAHNNGAMPGLSPGSFSGAPGSPITGKAAFNNPPYTYGIVERTSSEWTAGLLDTWRVDQFAGLPADLRVTGGALQQAYQAAVSQTGNANRPNYADGTVRYFTCQTCHMAPSTGLGCNKTGTPTRADLPRHDQTGSGYWMPDLIQYQDQAGTLPFGTALTTTQRDALAAGKVRAQAMLRSAASLSAEQAGQGQPLVVRVTNLTAHKLISGYPEGRRMWLNVRWYDGTGALIGEDGAYGPIGRVIDGTPVQSILDPERTVVIEARPGMDQQWASQLVGLGYPPGLALAYDRRTDQVEHTLGELAAEEPGTTYHTFHFVLNNVVTKDNRIPPFGFSYDQALTRSALPVPPGQFGDPGPGGTFDHWVENPFHAPYGAARADIRLYYQQTSWEYIQFLWQANDGLDPMMADKGLELRDAWLATGMSPPFEMAAASVTVQGPAFTPGEAARPGDPADEMDVTLDRATGALQVTYAPACAASDHAVYWGLGGGDRTWSGVVCSVGASGTASFDPGTPPPGGFLYFVIVGHNGGVEGSYGRNSAGVERPESSGLSACDLPQDLRGACDVP